MSETGPIMPAKVAKYTREIKLTINAVAVFLAFVFCVAMFAEKNTDPHGVVITVSIVVISALGLMLAKMSKTELRSSRPVLKCPYCSYVVNAEDNWVCPSCRKETSGDEFHYTLFDACEHCDEIAHSYECADCKSEMALSLETRKAYEKHPPAKRAAFSAPVSPVAEVVQVEEITVDEPEAVPFSEEEELDRIIANLAQKESGEVGEVARDIHRNQRLQELYELTARRYKMDLDKGRINQARFIELMKRLTLAIRSKQTFS